jgi:hypothetical protein
MASDSDPAERLAEYIAWLAQKCPTLSAKLLVAGTALRIRDHTIDTLKTITDTAWAEMDISVGIQAQLKIQMNKFLAAKVPRT